MDLNHAKSQTYLIQSSKQNSIVSQNIIDPDKYRHCTPQLAKRFARKNNYQQVFRSPLNSKPEFKMCRTPNTQSNCSFTPKDALQVQTGIISAKSIDIKRKTIQDIRQFKNIFSKPEFQSTMPQIRKFSQLNQNNSLESSKNLTKNQNAYHNQNDKDKNNKVKSSYLKVIAKQFKETIQTEEDQQLNDIKEQNKILKKENDFLKNNVIHLQDSLTKLDKDNLVLKRNFQEKTEKLNKEINMLHNSLMNQQYNSLNAQKKLKQVNSQVDTLNKQRNLIVGQIAKLSRAKLPKQYIDFQSCKQVCLEYQLNQIKNRFNQDRSQIERQLQQQVHKKDVAYRKLQQQVSKYQIANRMLLKRAQQAQKFKDTHKTCSGQYKRLKEKYSQMLDQYNQLKKRNIQLFKENNSFKNKIKEITSNDNKLSSNVNPIGGNYKINIYPPNNQNNLKDQIPPKSFHKKSVTRQVEQSALFDMSMFNSIKESNIYGSKLLSTNNSEMSLQFSLDISADVQGSQLHN